MPVAVRTFERLRDAAAALASEPGAAFLGGGTILVRRLNEGDLALRTIVRTTDPALREIRSAGSRITLGAGVTMAQIARTPELAFLAPVAAIVGGPAVRTMATVGGNLFAPHPYGDFAAALIALEGTVAIQGGYSARELPIEDFLRSAERSSATIAASVLFRRPEGAGAFRFRKLTRVHPKGVSVLSIAAHLVVSAGRISTARVAYGAMGPTALRARAVEAALAGRPLDEAGIGPALAVALEGCEPPTDALASAWYRRAVLPVQLKRLLLEPATAVGS
jgi:xanthine dehydrogenase small subunit